MKSLLPPLSPVQIPRLVLTLCILASALCISSAATVTGNLNDISIQALNTKMLFTPTTNILTVAAGLSAGPPKMIDTSAGAFSVVLETGDYTVSLPLIPYRAPFRISVPVSASTINITNLLSPPITYTYTNYLATSPVHVNATAVTVLAPASPATLLDSSATLPAGVLAARNVLAFEAFGSIADPGGNVPNVTFTLKLGSTTIWTRTKSCTASNWHLRGTLTVRFTGTSGSIAGSLAVMEDTGTPSLFSLGTTVTTVNTTGSLSVDLTAAIDNFTGSEAVTCDQLLVRLL